MIQSYFLSAQVLTLKFRIRSEWELVLAWIYISTVFAPTEKSRKHRKGWKAGFFCFSNTIVLFYIFPVPNKIARLVLLIVCFRYYTRADAEHAMRFINGTRLDDRIIRTDWDAGFKEGRQYGRGKTGGQVKTIPVHTLNLIPLRLSAALLVLSHAEQCVDCKDLIMNFSHSQVVLVTDAWC